MMRATAGIVLFVSVASFACGSSDSQPDDNAQPDNGAGDEATVTGGGAGGTAQGSSGGPGTSGSGGSGNAGMGGHGGSANMGGQAGTSAGHGGGAGAGGASNGGGGAGGGGGDSMHVVKACPTDNSAIGVWEAINPPDIPIPPPTCGGGPCYYGTKSPVLNPHDSSIVYLGTDKHGVFKSTDCGATWKKQNTGRGGANLDTGAQWTMVIDPVEPETLIANNGYGAEQGVFKSTNGGIDWDPLTPKGSVVATHVDGNFATRIAMDPTDRKHLVVSFHSNCTGEFAPGCVAETTDQGVTWKMIKMPDTGFEAAGIAMIDSKTWLFGNPFYSLTRTTDQGATWTKIADDGGYWLYRTAKGDYFLAGAAHGIQHSNDGINWTQTQTGPFYAVVGDGQTLYASPRYCDTNCVYTSPETDGKTWKSITTAVKGHGAVDMIYDPDHHLVYSSNEGGGFWRVRTH
jgi:hypothetical protein